MITWRADNPAAPPPMMQISMLPPLTDPSGGFVMPLSWAAYMRRPTKDVRQSWRSQEITRRASQHGCKRQFYQL